MGGLRGPGGNGLGLHANAWRVGCPGAGEAGLIAPPLPTEEYKKLSKEEKKISRQEEAKARVQALEKLAEQPTLTFGSFLWERQQANKPTRARPGAGDGGKFYEVYPTREMYEDEFNKIWRAQAKHHPALLSDEKRERIHHVIFTQRPLKPQKRGKCTYMSEHDRAYRAMPSFQRYRIYQEVNSLEWTTSDGVSRLRDYKEARDMIIELLEEKVTAKNGIVVWSKMKKILKDMDIVEGNFEFNYETPKRKGFDGNLTSHIMHHEDYVGKQWHDWDLDKQDRFISAILEQVPDEKSTKDEMREQTDEEVKERLMQDFGLSEFAAEKCTFAPLVDGTANVSLEAAKLMLEKMQDEKVNTETGEICLPIQSDAAAAVAKEVGGFINPFRKKGDGGKYEPENELPYYGEAFFKSGRHIIPGDRREEDKGDDRKYYGGVTNPTVHIALNQIRQVVNELIKHYGHPASIAIELGRNLPVGKKGREEIEKEQKENQEINEKLDKQLQEENQKINRDNRLRLRLWEELSTDPNGRMCPFSGEKIGKADLFSDSVEIEHLIPFSISLDDGRANKTICTRKANRDKGKQTPFQAFGHSPAGYNWDEIFERVKILPKSKQWRFQKDALEIWNGENKFTERHLNDTRYIGRLAREYLEWVCHTDKIDVLTGRLTWLLREQWGLTNVLREQDSPKDEKRKKNRDDHRHHAVDAIVIGMTNRFMLDKVSAAAGRAEDIGDVERLFPKQENGKSAIDPLDGFRGKVREVVQDIVVSHKIKRKKPRYALDKDGKLKRDKSGRRIKLSTDGQLHNETALGVVEGPNGKGKYKTVVRRAVDYIKNSKRIDAIRDPKLRAQFSHVFNKDGVDGVKKFAAEKKIRSLRCFEPEQKIIPIKDKDGNDYKAYKPDSNWGIEIYAFPEGHAEADEWEGVVISRFVANSAKFKPGETCRRQLHPAARLVMRLQINDCVEFEVNGRPQIMRLQRIDQAGRLDFAACNEANVDARNRNKAVEIIAYQGIEYIDKKPIGKKSRDKITFEIDKKKITENENAPGLRWREEDSFSYINKTTKTLKPLNPRKVHISPSGLRSYEKRRKPRRKS